MQRKIDLSEKNLAANLYELSREVVHDLFVVCRKAGIYSVNHPMVKNTVPRPFFGMQKVFAFKKYFSLVLTEGRLYANNIIINDVGAGDFVKDRMHDLELTSVLFEDTITLSDLETFIERFVKRVPTTSPEYFMQKFLERHKVFSIRANTELGDKLFNTGLRYHNNVGEDFTVRTLIANYFAGDPHLAVVSLSSQFQDTGQQAEVTGIDYHVDLVNHILPEKFIQLPSSELLEMAEDILAGEAGLDEEAAGKLARLVRSFDYHPKRDELLEEIRAKLVARGMDEKLLGPSLSQVGVLKLEAAQAVDQILGRIFADDGASETAPDFHDSFMRLVRTRQLGKAASVVEAVIEHLASDKAAFRRHALSILEDIIRSGLSAGEHDFLDVIIRHLQALFAQGRETFEFSQVVSFLLQSMLSLRRYEPVAAFLESLKNNRHIDAGVVTYESLTVKRIFDDLDKPELTARLVKELEFPGNAQAKPVRTILTALQSEEVALQLATIVIHPERSVRQQCLKILSELGWPAVNVFSGIIRDDKNFERPEGRYELPDEKWYLVRNALFVLGNLGDPAACNALRVRLADTDVRVRRELIKALEKIGGDPAVDLLMMLSEDADPSVRENAVIALGQFKRPDLVPFFIDLMSRQKAEIPRLITAIAGTGSAEGVEFLISLLTNQDKLKSFASGKASVNDLRQMIAAVLKRLGDDNARTKVDELESKIGGKGIFSSDSGLSKTAKVLINKITPKK